MRRVTRTVGPLLLAAVIGGLAVQIGMSALSSKAVAAGPTTAPGEAATHNPDVNVEIDGSRESVTINGKTYAVDAADGPTNVKFARGTLTINGKKVADGLPDPGTMHIAHRPTTGPAGAKGAAANADGGRPSAAPSGRTFTITSPAAGTPTTVPAVAQRTDVAVDVVGSRRTVTVNGKTSTIETVDGPAAIKFEAGTMTIDGKQVATGLSSPIDLHLTGTPSSISADGSISVVELDGDVHAAGGVTGGQ